MRQSFLRLAEEVSRSRETPRRLPSVQGWGCSGWQSWVGAPSLHARIRCMPSTAVAAPRRSDESKPLLACPKISRTGRYPIDKRFCLSNCPIS